MGLPLFITPVESEATSKAKEPIASPSRTSIRRARLSRGQHARTLDASRRRQALRMFENDTQVGRESSRTSRSPPDVEEMMRGYADYELSRAFGRTGSAQEPDGRHTLQARMRRFAQERQRRESEALGPRDTPSFERQQGPGEPGPLMPPAPEPRDFAAAIGERQRVRDLRRMARRHAAPTPPNAEEDRVSIDTSEDTQPIEGNTVLSNERTGPRPLPESGRGIWNALERLRNSDADMLSPNDPEPGRRQYARRPWSNIVERERARRRPVQARLDGLGDRDRSLSPFYNDQEPMWETLLTSITPDPQPPSAGSSFASSSAAAAASSSNSMPQSMTSSMTSVDRTEDDPMNQECDMSDSNDGSDWDAEDAEGTADNTDALTRGGERLWRTYADVVTAREGPARRIASRDTEHLGGMHRIISRLVERDDIPDEWWAGAGLIRREPSS